MPTDHPLASLVRPELSQLQAYLPHPAPPGTVRLDANESPFELPAERKRALVARAAESVALNRYPDAGCTALREAVAMRAGCDPEDVVLGNGTDEVIAMVLGALSRPREGHAKASVLFPWPSFVMYRVSALALGVDPVAVALDAAWDLDLEAFREASATRRPNVLFLPSPNNPTGNRFSDDRVEALVRAHPDALVVLDEAYGPFAGAGYDALRGAHPHVAQLQTLSKVGFAALRCGWAILPREVAAEVNKVRQPYNLDALTQAIAREVLTTEWAWIEETVATVRAERVRLVNALRTGAGLRVTPSHANFVWLRVPDAARTHAALLARGVLVRSFHAQGGRMAQQLRITVGTPAENDALLSALPFCL